MNPQQSLALPATKEDLRESEKRADAQFTEHLRESEGRTNARITELRADTRAEMDALRKDLKGDIRMFFGAVMGMVGVLVSAMVAVFIATAL